MFDPFRDFETAGYLRNLEKEKDPNIIKRVEHAVFMRNLDRAMAYLGSKEKLRYGDFLEVHRILFSEFYPWAGCDRTSTAPNLAISKGRVMFCSPVDIARAINEGLRLAQSGSRMRGAAGTVMGFFAYGHPFLDGNGRTMLLVHCELSHRAGFSIDWSATKKGDYLAALTSEIEAPGQGHLDQYLSVFIRDQAGRPKWSEVLSSLPGLDGMDESTQVDGDLNDPAIAAQYRRYEEKRNQSYKTHEMDGSVCSSCKSAPCICDKGSSEKL